MRRRLIRSVPSSIWGVLPLSSPQWSWPARPLPKPPARSRSDSLSIPLTGGLASNGRAILAAYQMWQDDINAKGGLIGRKVEFVYYDDQSNPALVPGIYASCWMSTKSTS